MGANPPIPGHHRTGRGTLSAFQVPMTSLPHNHLPVTLRVKDMMLGDGVQPGLKGGLALVGPYSLIPAAITNKRVLVSLL